MLMLSKRRTLYVFLVGFLMGANINPRRKEKPRQLYEETNKKLLTWIRQQDPIAIDLWREALAQLRQLHGDVWNGVRFFLTVNGIIIAALFGLAQSESPTFLTGVLLSVLAFLGLFVTLVAHSILAKHRDYYLQMLLRKTLIEIQLGFYQQKVACIDLSFPWNVDKQSISSVLADPHRWLVAQKRRKGSITRSLFHVYEGVVAVYVLSILAIGYGFYCGFF
jgi:hypothetical protein